MRLSFFGPSSAVVLLLCLAGVSPVCAQTKPVGTGVITGRVLLGEKPAVGVIVGLVRADVNGPVTSGALAKDATDTDGRYRLSQVPAGNFRVTPLAPGYISSSDNPGFFEQGKSVQLREGETVENLDFTLTRGGVITGKVTDVAGKPLAGERLNVMKLEQGGRKSFWSPDNGMFMLTTDDRGIYRLYGMPEGRYLISVGLSGTSGISFQRGVKYRRTYYPDTPDENQAKPIEVTPGDEVKDIDIRMGVETVNGQAVTVRVVDAETGAPVAGVSVNISALQGNRANSLAALDTDASGSVRMDNVMPGRYGATLRGGVTPSEYFSEMTAFEVQDSDVEGVVIRAQRGATLFGKAVIEGSTDFALLAKLTQLRMYAFSRPVPRGNTPAPPMQQVGASFKLNPDGSFRASGLAPGLVQFSAAGAGGPSAFTLLRLELAGVPQKDGIEVTAGQQVQNVRLVFGYGQAVVRGQVQIVGGALPEGARVSVSARRTDGQTLGGKFAQVDVRGRFTLEALVAGEYELTLTASPRMVVGQGPDGSFSTSSAPAPGLPRTVKQTITVPQIGEVPVSFTLDLTPRENK